MPSLLHEALVLLFRNRPSLAPELLRDTLDQRLPEYDEVEVQDANLNQIVPTEYRADLVVLLRADTPVFGIVLEIQLNRDGDKAYSWPLYASALRARLRCPTCVLVIAPDAGIARWAARPIDTGQPRSPFFPLVLGPAGVPRVTDTDVARQAPELAVLSAQAHGHEEGAIEVALAALQAASGLDDERGVLYFDLVLAAINETTRRRLEELMQTGDYTYQSDFARKYVREGEAKGRIESLLEILAARAFELTDDRRAMVKTCTDLGQLDTWTRRALRVETVDEIFDSNR